MFESPLQFPSLVEDLFQIPEIEKLSTSSIDHAPRFLLLYGSLRERSFSRLLTFEAARLLTAMGWGRSKYLTLLDYLWLIAHLIAIQRYRSYVNWLYGQRVWFGLHQSDMAL